MNLADDFNENKKYNDAIETYTNALTIKPMNSTIKADLLYCRAKATYKIGNLQDAIDDSSKALLIDSSYIDALLLRAQCYSYLDDFASSVQDYENAYKITKHKKNNELAERISVNLNEVRMRLRHQLAEERIVCGDEHYRVKNITQQ